ncbi:Autophagy-related protein 27 [Cytospora mali]|uniref:Autophagy-related protein 27 n=1 Tax=Cytospora mali TaxID=578113 RepID=A0A194UUC6_CYTMA|nr:Autophagy-related protein 27 [Valsa mali var. pyri (nom. inval.)]
MRWSSSSTSPAADSAAGLLSLVLLATPATAMLRCEQIRVDGQQFNFKDLGGPHSVVTTQEQPSWEPYDYINTTYTLDLCAPLKKDGPRKESCPNGSRVCGIRRGIEGETDTVTDVLPIAGDLKNHGMGDLDARITRLKTSDSSADSKREGVRIVLNGGRHQKRKQLAIVEMLCDAERTGKEGEWDPKDDKYEPGQEETEKEGGGEGEGDAAGRRRRQEDGGEDDGGDGDGDGDGEKSERQLLKPDSALIFDSYGPMTEDANVDVLRLTWYTKYACEGLPDEEYPDNNSRHWGFFTWMVIIVFLTTASYIIFGSWLNYSRYGARGWDLLPHGDTIRDIPYLLKDWTRRVLNTVQGSGSRGGYSAV